MSHTDPVDVHAKSRTYYTHEQANIKSANVSAAPDAKKPTAPAKDAPKKETVAPKKPEAAPAAEEDKLVLTNAVQGQVVTRFPPEASGFLHIGHAKALLVNAMLRTKYEGKMVFRFDDTNPVKEKAEFEHAIIEDIKSLGVSWDEGPTYSSNYFDTYIKHCDDLIARGLAYCDMTPKAEMQKARYDGVATEYRDNSVERNQQLWAAMQKADPSVLGKDENGDDIGICCVRAKISIDNPNKALRDPTIYRINLNPHPRTGDKYKVYPTYDFCCPIVDSIEGVTHALRTNEYHDRNDQYIWFLDNCGLKHRPQVEDFSRLNLEYTVMSKRKLTAFVNDKTVTGWDDPRFPTVRGLLRRGLTVQALREFVKVQGMSKAVNYMEWSKIWNFNNQAIDFTAVRYTVVNNNAKVVCKAVGGPSELVAKTRSKHPKNADLGEKTYYQGPTVFLDLEDVLTITEGDEITLMGWGNAFLENFTRNDAGTIVGADLRLNPEGDVKKTKSKLTWVSDNAAQNVICDVHEYDHLLTKKKPDPDEPIDGLIAKVTEFKMECVAEAALKDAKKGDFIQLERRGFCIVDAVEPRVSLIAIPDGKEKLNHLSAKAAYLKANGLLPTADEKKKDAAAKPAADTMSLEEKRALKKAKKAANAAKQ